MSDARDEVIDVNEVRKEENEWGKYENICYSADADNIRVINSETNNTVSTTYLSAFMGGTLRQALQLHQKQMTSQKR